MFRGLGGGKGEGSRRGGVVLAIQLHHHFMP